VKLVSWNVNSIEVRLPRVLEFLAEHARDVVCTQETKCEDDAFAVEELAADGNRAVHHPAGRFGRFLQVRGIEDPASGADVHEARGVLLDFRSTLQSDPLTRGPNVGRKRSSESVRTGLHTVCGMYRWIADNPHQAQAGLDDPRCSRAGWEYATLLRRGEWCATCM
jgi:hypothetical protein